MSLDRAIAAGHEHRQPHRGSKSFDCTCRNHGSCPWCDGNRTHAARKAEAICRHARAMYDCPLCADHSPEPQDTIGHS